MYRRSMSNTGTLYERLGERDAIEAVVDRFYERVLTDADLKPHFEGVDVDALRRHQVTFLSAVTGGPAEYAGRDMRAAHDHLDLTDEDFDAVATHLDRTLREFEVDVGSRTEVLDAVGDLRSEIVTA